MRPEAQMEVDLEEAWGLQGVQSLKMLDRVKWVSSAAGVVRISTNL